MDPPRCNFRTQDVGVLDLSGTSLTGTIPGSISVLTALQVVDLDNILTGVIPTGISAMSALTRLYLNGNKLTGSIPDGISVLTALQDLDFGMNQINGIHRDS